ncbi:hypothetical protein LUZ62_072376 [Rhynchospora pubera]|uniref:Peptidase A1 domain-containing protein n=1 Tax=Rhynchospora pubera TaxID=906938 RepID=A0AAV8D4B3_9POAL|nr:hypothetical protein LUZ62_072376 [Rhynchospora pubera]
MGSAKKFLWLIFALMSSFLEPSLGKSPNVPSGFKAKIYHPGYYPQLSPAHDHFQAMINHSINRLHHFNNALTEEPIGLVLSGDMDYIIELDIGKPPRTYHLNIDTGSHVTWLQHKDCITCIDKTKIAASYDDKISSTAKEISCYDEECDENNSIQCDDYSDRCTYTINYMDGSNSSGIMYLDQFTFLSIDESYVVLESVRFGGAFYCSEGKFHHDIQGVFGLSRNRRSFISQYGFQQFSYCLPDYKNMAEQSPYSNMLFGTEAQLAGNSTAMLPHQEYYVISLNGISVRGIRLELDPSIFKLSNGRGGTVIDTGTPITVIPNEAYNKVVETLVPMIKLPRVFYRNSDKLCFNGGLKDMDKHVPDMTLHFEGLDLHIIPRSLFFVSTDKVNICLAMQPMGYNRKYNIFGAILQQNINIAFDLKENKIFMSPMTCASLI